MRFPPRPDDFEQRRARVRRLSDSELRAHFWQLAQQIVAPLLEQARTHTTPAIERSVLLRMGFSSLEAKALVDGLAERDLLGQGAGRLVLDLGRRLGLPAREAGLELIAGRHWDGLAP